MGRGGATEWETLVQSIERLAVGGGHTPGLEWTKASEKWGLWGICLRNSRGCMSKERASGPGPQFMAGCLFTGSLQEQRRNIPLIHQTKEKRW